MKLQNTTFTMWGLGIGDWGLGIGPNPQSPIPNPQSPIPNPQPNIKKLFNSKYTCINYLLNYILNYFIIMAGQSQKKNKIKKQGQNKLSKFSILLATLFYIIINAYHVIFHEYEFTRRDTIGFLILTCVNFSLYRLLDVFSESYFYLPLIDLLIINLSVMVLINFHWKFWFLYLIIPGYFLCKGAKKVYDHVKTLSQPDANATPETQTQAKEQKKKIIKVKQ